MGPPNPWHPRRELLPRLCSAEWLQETPFDLKGANERMFFQRWWLNHVEPTHLKNMLVNMGSSSPVFG